MTDHELTAAERQKKFLEVFKRFDSIAEGAKWIAQVTGTKPITVMVWRTKKRSGYVIPKRPFKMLMDALENTPTAG